MSRPGSRSRGRAALVGFGVSMITLLAGCGGAPSRAEFTDKITDTIGVDELLGPLREKGVDDATARKLIRTFVECQYDALEQYPDVLQKAYDDPGNTELAAQIDSLTGECVNDLAVAMSEAASKGAGT